MIIKFTSLFIMLSTLTFSVCFAQDSDNTSIAEKTKMEMPSLGQSLTSPQSVETARALLRDQSQDYTEAFERALTHIGNHGSPEDVELVLPYTKPSSSRRNKNAVLALGKLIAKRSNEDPRRCQDVDGILKFIKQGWYNNGYHIGVEAFRSLSEKRDCKAEDFVDIYFAESFNLVRRGAKRAYKNVLLDMESEAFQEKIISLLKLNSFRALLYGLSLPDGVDRFMYSDLIEILTGLVEKGKLIDSLRDPLLDAAEYRLEESFDSGFLTTDLRDLISLLESEVQ